MCICSLGQAENTCKAADIGVPFIRKLVKVFQHFFKVLSLVESKLVTRHGIKLKSTIVMLFRNKKHTQGSLHTKWPLFGYFSSSTSFRFDETWKKKLMYRSKMNSCKLSESENNIVVSPGLISLYHMRKKTIKSRSFLSYWSW